MNQPPHRRFKHRRFRFGFRLFLVAVTLFCLLLGFKVHQVRTERGAVATLRKQQAIIVYDYQRDKTLEPPGPAWLRAHLGDDFFAHVEVVSFIVPFLGGPTGPDIDDDLMAHVGELRWLRYLALEDCELITDAGIAELSGLSQLRGLRLERMNISDRSLATVGRLRNLETLLLDDTIVTDVGVKHLRGLSYLKELHLTGTGISDESLDVLGGLKRLESLQVFDTKITEEGEIRLRKLLPDCDIFILR